MVVIWLSSTHVMVVTGNHVMIEVMVVVVMWCGHGGGGGGIFVVV